jgi:RNA polymerase primary sigma factor
MKDIAEIYSKEISRYRILDRVEEFETAEKAKAGDQAAIEKLVCANLRFVFMIAKKFQNDRLPFMDLVNASNIGLIRAAQSFDPERGCRFITYAVHWIKDIYIIELYPCLKQ